MRAMGSWRPFCVKPGEAVAVERHPRALLRGLIHSEGAGVMNRIKGTCEYPRSFFTNRPADIGTIFVLASIERNHVPTYDDWTVSIAGRQCENGGLHHRI